MNAMQGFTGTLLILWTLECIAAYFYSQKQHIPTSIVFAVVPAFLIETGLYLSAGLRETRARWERLGPRRLATCMTLTAVVPYALYSIPTGVFDWVAAGYILALSAGASFWFVFGGRRTVTDLLYLVLMALPILLKAFPKIYADPFPKLQLFVLGLLMWYRTGLLGVLAIRKMEGINFGFVPQRTDWAVGLRNFLYFLPLGLVVGYSLDYFNLRVSLGWMLPLVVVGTFILTLCVLATAEEFFFRGLLQQLLARTFRSDLVGLAAASILFGLAHIFSGQFPNWRFVLLATCAGVFYGRAYLQARSIRAAMVTHALVVTLWVVFLK